MPLDLWVDRCFLVMQQSSSFDMNVKCCIRTPMTEGDGSEERIEQEVKCPSVVGRP